MKFIKKTKNIFLLDGFGALLTTLLIFFVLRTFNDFFGLSKSILGYLAALALVFSIYSILCYFLVSDNWKSFLKIICIANIFYCVLTFGVVIFNYQNISILGIIYFLGEIIVIVRVVYLEITIIKRQ